MKKLFYLGFCLVLAMGVGCAITDYALITDNDQTRNGQGTGTVNTNGKAHIREGSQVASGYPDGYDELFSFVDQSANGDRVLTTYDNFSSSFPIFHSDFYCNPDWQGCAVSTSQDPQVGDVDIFDYSANFNCLGARSLYLLVASSRYYGECGRSVQDLGALLMMGQPKNGGLFYLLTPANTNLVLNSLGDGASSAITLNADIPVQLTKTGLNGKLVVSANNPVLGRMSDAVANFADNHGGAMNISLMFNGLTYTKTAKVLPSMHKLSKNF